MAEGMEQGMKALQHCGLTREQVFEMTGTVKRETDRLPISDQKKRQFQRLILSGFSQVGAAKRLGLARGSANYLAKGLK